jgi:hypothetical protein
MQVFFRSREDDTPHTPGSLSTSISHLPGHHLLYRLLAVLMSHQRQVEVEAEAEAESKRYILQARTALAKGTRQIMPLFHADKQAHQRTPPSLYEDLRI